MSLIHIGLIILFLLLFIIGLLMIIYSTYINNWVFNWSTHFMKAFGDIPNPQGQREASLWIIRIFSFVIMSICVLFLYFLFTDIYW
jgi:hypothetical protein